MMDKQYKEIKGWIGMSIRDAVILLHTYDYKGERVCLEFNGTMLHSDTVTMNSAYLDILGITREEFNKRVADNHAVRCVDAFIKEKEKQNDQA